MKRPERLLVLVPSDALRTQTFDKFVRLGLLSKLGVLPPCALRPVVGVLNKSIRTAAQLRLIERCNVVVTTVAALQYASTPILKQFTSLFDCVFFDEAHHVPANSWQRVADSLSSQAVVQFTATPFRLDGLRIPGRIIYTFPLRLAQEQGYFRQIRFREVFEPDPEQADNEIAKEAVQQLREDLKSGYDHFLLARAYPIERAKKLFEEIYSTNYKDLNPILMHSKTSGYSEKLDAIKAGKHRVIVCVDMFGEGFDFPRLKVAALHDPHRSLGITLQFTGRFTREATGIGDATLVANTADAKVSDSVEDLYAEDSDWNKLIPALSSKAIQSQIDFSDFLQNMQSEKLDEEIFGLNVLRPKTSTVIFKATSFNPRYFRKGVRKGCRVERVWNSKEKDLLIFITKSRPPIEWASIKETTNEIWDLYIVSYDAKRQLLFIYSSQTGTLHQDLAKAVGGASVRLLDGEHMFRAFHGVTRLVFHNAGLYSRGKKLRFRMYTGLDIGEAIDPTQQVGSTKSNLFAVGYENGQRVSIGVSHKGRVWAMQSSSVPDWRQWCESTATKIIDSKIPTTDYLKHTLIPREIATPPDSCRLFTVTMPVEWYSTDMEPFRLLAAKKEIPFHSISPLGCTKISAAGIDIELIGINDQVYRFSLTWGPSEGQFAVVQSSGPILELRSPSWSGPLAEYLRDHPPVINCFDGSEIIGPRFLQANAGLPFTYDSSAIVATDWKGVDITVESKWKKQQKRTNSIQAALITLLQAQNNSFVFDDDDSGEAADVIEIAESGEECTVRFYHCKYAGGSDPGLRVKDLYEVCGQAIRSVRWTTDPRNLLTHIQQREALRNGRPTRFEKGQLRSLVGLKRRLKKRRVRFEIVIVQPGLSKSQLDAECSSILGAANRFIIETTGHPLGVFASQ